MIKQAFVICYKDKPIYVGELKTFKNVEEYIATTKAASKNLESLIAMVKNDHESLEAKCENLKEELNKVKAELAYNRGDITKERYEELCGLNK